MQIRTMRTVHWQYVILAIFLHALLKADMPEAFLRRSRCLEKVEASEYRTFPGGYHDTFTNRVGMDAKWDITGIHESEPFRH